MGKVNSVSVIIPTRNRKHLIGKTINNILSQSLSPHEIIIVDDGSTDGSWEWLQDNYSNKIILVKNKGTGPGAARNTGLKIATGDAIQFFDSDDLMTKNKLQVQSELLEMQHADFVYGPFAKAIYKENKWQQVDLIMQYYPLSYKKRFANYVLEGWCNITQSALFSKSFIDKVGYWNEGLMTSEDYEYWFRISQKAKSYFHENKSCVIYRQHYKQITNQDVTNKTRWMDGIKAMQCISSEINKSHNKLSILKFKGRLTLSKKKYDDVFGEHISDASFRDILCAYYARLEGKLGRIKTKTNWQPMHGPLQSDAVFKKYIKLL